MINPQDRVHPVISSMDMVDGGITKREYFAVMAMQGMLSFGNENVDYSHAKIPMFSVELADKLIEELNKKS